MGQLKIPQFPPDLTVSDLYEVYVNGMPMPVMPARVSALPFNIWWLGHQRPLDQTEMAAFVSFEAEGPVTLTVVPKCKKMTTASDIRIRPLSKSILPIAQNESVSFELQQFGAYTFEVDGFAQALHIFFNPLRDFKPAQGHTVLHYGPGVHHVGNVEIDSHTTVIVDAGAVVYGSITAIGAEDVQILGYGIIDGSEEERVTGDCLLPYYPDSNRKSVLKEMIRRDKAEYKAYMKNQRDLFGCVKLYACTNVRVEGIIMRDSATFALLPAGCDNLMIDNVKTIGMWRYNSDGIDLFNCRNVIIQNSFLRDFDDCIVIKGYEGWDAENNENILVQGCVVWCDWGRALEFGAETNADEYRNIIMRDCDVIHGSAVMIDLQTHNRAEIHHCLYEDIRAEYNKYQLPEQLQVTDDVVYTGEPNSRQPQLISIPIVNDDLYCVKNGHGSVHDVVFKNICIYKDDEVELPEIYLGGIKNVAGVSDITVATITVNGEVVEYPTDKISVYEEVHNVSFR